MSAKRNWPAYPGRRCEGNHARHRDQLRRILESVDRPHARREEGICRRRAGLRHHRRQRQSHPDQEMGAGLARRQRRRPDLRPHPLLDVRRLRRTRAHSGESIVYDTHFQCRARARSTRSLTLFLHDPLAAVDYSYANGVVEKLEINMALKKFVDFTASIKALSGRSAKHLHPVDHDREPLRPAVPRREIRAQLRGPAGTLTATGTAASTIHVTGLQHQPADQPQSRHGRDRHEHSREHHVATIVSSTAYDLSQRRPAPSARRPSLPSSSRSRAPR